MPEDFLDLSGQLCYPFLVKIIACHESFYPAVAVFLLDDVFRRCWKNQNAE